MESAAWPRMLAIAAITAGLAVPAGLTLSILTAEEALAACAMVPAANVNTIVCTGASAAISNTPTAPGWTFTVEQTAPVFNTTVTGNTTINNTSAGADYDGTFTQAANTRLTNTGTVLTFNNTAAGARDSVVTVNLNGDIVSNGGATDATNFTNGGVYNINIGSTGTISATDDGIVVRAIDVGVSVNNAGSVTTTNGGGGGNADDAILIAAGGAPGTNVVGYANVTNSGTLDATAGAGVSISANGAIGVRNTSTGNINGGSNAVFINGNNLNTVTFENAGHVQSTVGAGVLIQNVGDVIASNTSSASLIGATNGFVVNNANSVVYNNQDAPQLGLTEGLNGAGLLITNVTTSVAIDNQFGGVFRGTNDGIRASSIGTSFELNNSSGGLVAGITGPNSDGVDLSQIGGHVLINNTVDGRIVGNANGIVINNVTGPGGPTTVTINNDVSGITFGGGIAGVNGDGIFINNVHGNVVIQNSDVSSIEGGTAGGGAMGDGIDVTGVTGDITITNLVGSIISGNQRGIVAISTGTTDGDITVNSATGAVTATLDDGITATTAKAAGTVDVDVGTLTANSGHGVLATATNGATTINVDVWNSINAGFLSFEDGVRAEGSTTSAVNITNRANATINGGDDGVVVLQGGTVKIVNQAGATIASGQNNALPGTNASEAIVVAVGAAPGSGAGTGRIAGTVEIDNWGLVSSSDVFGGVNTINGEAINVSSVGAVTITNYAGGMIRGSSNGAGTGAIEVDTAGLFTLHNSGLVDGTGTTVSNGAVIDLHSAAGSTINNYAGGTIRSTDSVASDLIVRSNFGSAFGAAVMINNNGTMLGNIDLIGAFNDTFNNTSATTWTFTGVSDFGAGDGDDLNNTGQIRPIGVATINGLEFFNNGAPGFGNNGYINQRDGVLGDVFTVNPTGGATLVFYGDPGNSWLLQDVDLGDFAQSVADKFKINGNVNPDGSTGIVVDDHNNFAGAYNPNGITVVDVTGATGPGDFFLEDGPIQKGIWTYDLFLNPANSGGPDGDGSSKNCDGVDNCWVIASYLDNYSVPQTMGIVQGMWHTLADSWIERASDLRTLYGASGGSGADLTYISPVPSVPAQHAGDTGIWGRLIGQASERDVAYVTEPFPDQFVTVDAGYTEHFGAVQGGIDHTFNHGNGATVIGLLGGYAHNTVDFVDAGDTAKITAPHVGAYVNWLNGGTYVDALFKADFLNVEYNVAGEDVATKGLSLGGRLEAGHRHQMGHAFIEPVAALAYVHTSLDPVNVGGTDIVFDDGTSLRGKIGGRLGFTSANEGGQLDPYVHAYVGSEFLGQNTVFLDSGPGLTIVDDVSGIFGEVGGGFNFNTADRSTAIYGQANYIFSDGYHAGNAKAGVRLNW